MRCRFRPYLMGSRIVAITVAFCFFLIFFFVPETFWDRTPVARGKSAKRSRSRSRSPGKHHRFHLPRRHSHAERAEHAAQNDEQIVPLTPGSPQETPQLPKQPAKVHRVGFVDDPTPDTSADLESREKNETSKGDYFSSIPGGDESESNIQNSDVEKQVPNAPSTSEGDSLSQDHSIHYTDFYRSAPPKSYVQSLKPYNGRLADDKWIKVMIRPLILLAYPAVLWSSLVYSLAVGWLIVLSESVAHVYRDRHSYNFTALQVGLVYISPFVGGVLGTAVAGKISDLIVRYMARKNDGVYEPEFRLVMALPIAISTVVGLMGFGWSAEEKDAWIVPTVFFGIISFGCSLASTTAVTFVVDSYRQYAGEALVSLNVCKSGSRAVPCCDNTNADQIYCTASSSRSSSPIG